MPKLEKQAKELISKKYTGGDAAQEASRAIIHAVKFMATNYNDPAVDTKAELLAQNAVELNPTEFPERFQVWQVYANILYKQGKKAVAIEKLRKAIELILVDDPRFNYKKQCGEELIRMEKGQKIW